MERIRAIAIERGLSLNELSEQIGKGLIPLGMVKKVTNSLVRKRRVHSKKLSINSLPEVLLIESNNWLVDSPSVLTRSQNLLN
jgi:hypothetical protein